MSHQPETTSTHIPESSGTTVAQLAAVPPELERLIESSPLVPLQRTNQHQSEGEEQALESHEVIELQSFSERKTWIEEKIKFLELMPPIEVFVGLEAVKSSAEEVPGLPTRAELQRWLAEHDAIEKETEIFDTGELAKLRQLTKGASAKNMALVPSATQRNLSPEDTDVIELTLTTIYALDKLLHLLRNRSENLELLGIRITWEEHRTGAWVDRRHLIGDLATFLSSRARWSPSVYDELATPPSEEQPTLRRRGSMASIASSIGSESSVNSAAFSRSTRFKMAEILSRDAAQLTGRVTSLKHGKITAAGKVLDKLIDQARKPVPDELLDEQDRLEEKGIAEMETISKFVMNVIMQWRKADEIYVETMKDQTAAQNLLEEIEIAKLHHPTTRQGASFVSRADAILKRLVMRNNLSVSANSIPMPEHPLFGDQQESNASLLRFLSSEVSSAISVARKVDTLAKDYRATCEAVKRAETLSTSAHDLITTFTTVIDKLSNGVSSGEADGDGKPPVLSSEACLDPSHHSVFLALLPSILESHSQANDSTSTLLRTSGSILATLDFAGIDPNFRPGAVATLNDLSAHQEQAQLVVNDVIARTTRLREARKVWTSLSDCHREVEGVRRRLWEAVEKRQLKETSPSHSPRRSTGSGNVSVPEVEKQLEKIEAQFTRDVDLPLRSLQSTLETPVNTWITEHIANYGAFIASTRQIIPLLGSLDKQADAVSTLRTEFEGLHRRIEAMKAQIHSDIDDLLATRLANGNVSPHAMRIQESREKIEADVHVFIDNLPSRLPFISRHPDSYHVSTFFTEQRFSLDEPQLDEFSHPTKMQLPFSLADHDNVRRTQGNGFVMTLNGGLEGLSQDQAHFNLARLAKEIDTRLQAVNRDIGDVEDEIREMTEQFEEIVKTEDPLKHLVALSQDLEEALVAHRGRIAKSIKELQDTLGQMGKGEGVRDLAIREGLQTSRSKAITSAEAKFHGWREDALDLQNTIKDAIDAEQDRLERLKVEEEQRQEAQRLRLIAEEKERVRLEKERQEAEERQRLEELRLKEEQEREAERQRLAAEEAERQRIERERLEREEQERQEALRLAEAKRLEEEQARLAAEEAERARLEREKAEMEEKLRVVEEQLAAERQLQAEKERASAAEAERLRLEAEEKERLRVEAEKQAEIDIREAVEKERARADKERRAMIKEDVFGLRIAPSLSQEGRTPELSDLQTRILALRKRLRAVSMEGILRPPKTATQLPSQDVLLKVVTDLTQITAEVDRLPTSVEDPSIDAELRSLRTEVEASAEWVRRLKNLASLSDALQLCDAALSDLLEHIDSYPECPSVLASPHRSALDAAPEEQMIARIAYTKGVIEAMSSKFSSVSDDVRAIAEKNRIMQTWADLEEMGLEKIGRRSRPVSSTSSRASSGRDSIVSVVSGSAGRPGSKKTNGYGRLSIGGAPSTRGRHLAPGGGTPRRAVSGEQPLSRMVVTQQTRPASQMSTSSNRQSFGAISASIYNTTFASRQRTTSLTASPSKTPTAKKPAGVPSRARAQTNQNQRSVSPSDSNHSRSGHGTNSRSSTSMSTWSRAPRNSLSSMLPPGLGDLKTPPKRSTPPKKPPVPRKKYVADPKHKLDVAVGDVVNRLPVAINIEGVLDTWKDQSGKYWIGDLDPKLCFCRILRSRTVMVRVGGGWQELSKFIQDHFAESFRLLPESPPRPGGPEERWISSATLLESAEAEDTFPAPPRTPEPTGPYLPSFALSTPSGQSPRSLKSSPSLKGSPLTPLQFMRRADPEMLRPATPSKAPLSRARSPNPNPNPNIHAPIRTSVWRP
ncbi:hypothetical protein BDN72DRAFT_853157 [Pluteus cervinus]|uniref:Uncharacterized protein n=1 Tax=Pluteus cervinus TaxID=181527 RepID=A0ACD3BCW4_9AGAR|nr:hypothetical protein BDN72DRAFT_853157 [Pluteus cervinus]